MFPERLPEFFSAHPILSLGIVAITLALILNELSRFTRGYRTVSPSELTRLINRENALVIDVSPLNDFDKGHIVGSKHVALSQFDPESKLLANVKEMPVALVCRNGMQSAQKATRLAKAGFKHVYLLEGGVAAWQSADLPLARGKGGK